MPRRIRARSGLASFLRRPAVQLGTVLFIALVVILIALVGKDSNAGLPAEVDVDQAHQMYLNGAFTLDVSWPVEWDEFHAPNSTPIPLDQLYNRLNEIPKDREILVIAHSVESGQKARDLLRSAGFNATCMTVGLNDWYTRGYPIEGAPPQ